MKRFVFLFGVLSLLAQPCWSQESGSKTAPAYAQASQTTPAEQADTKAKANPEEAAIRGELQEYVKVFNEHEA